VDDRALLRELKLAIQSTDGRSAEAQAQAIDAVLRRYGASVADIHRLLGWANKRRRAELTSLQRRIDGLIETRENHEIDQATADAVDLFLRGRGGPQ
jgi:hypothetical protein